MTNRFLPGVPAAQVEAMLNVARGSEITSGKFDSPKSSSALAANTFGLFLNRPHDLPPLPGCDFVTWPVCSLALERTVNFPWRGGRHPVLDVLITTPSALIGIESKRFEPFRTKKAPSISEAYWRPVWGDRMEGYQQVRDGLHQDSSLHAHLDAAQLFKHAFALRTQVHRTAEYEGLTPILMYLYAEPGHWSRDGKPIGEDAKARHRDEIADFAKRVEGDEVTFVSCSYHELLSAWHEGGTPEVRSHTEAVIQCFAP